MHVTYRDRQERIVAHYENLVALQDRITQYKLLLGQDCSSEQALQRRLEVCLGWARETLERAKDHRNIW